MLGYPGHRRPGRRRFGAPPAVCATSHSAGSSIGPLRATPLRAMPCRGPQDLTGEREALLTERGGTIRCVVSGCQVP